MQKGVKPLRKRHPASRHIREKSPAGKAPVIQYTAVAALVLAGVVIGAVLARKTGIAKEQTFGILMQEMLSKEAAAKGFGKLFLSSFFSSAVLLCIAFIFGLCAAGIIGHVAVLLFKGAGIGLTMGYVYLQYGVKGVSICALFILPWAIVTCLSVMIACREGIRFSLHMAGALAPSGNPPHLWPGFCDYCYKYVFCFALVLIAALIQAASTVAFSSLFFS